MALESQLASLGPAHSDRIGVLLFDPQRPLELIRLVVSARTLQVESVARGPIAQVLQSGRGLRLRTVRGQSRREHRFFKHDTLMRIKFLSSGSSSESGGPDPDDDDDGTFCHGVLQSDWLQFCRNVDGMVQKDPEQAPHSIGFVGFASAFNCQTGDLSSNFHFNSDDVSGKMGFINKRVRLGLTCPILQSKIAKYVAFRYRKMVDFEYIEQERGKELLRHHLRRDRAAEATKQSSHGLESALEWAKHMRSVEAGALMQSIIQVQKARVAEIDLWGPEEQDDEDDDGGLGDGAESKQDNRFDLSTTSSIFERYNRIERLEKMDSRRHSWETFPDPRERERMHAILIARGKSELRRLGSRQSSRKQAEEQKVADNCSIPLPKHLTVPNIVTPNLGMRRRAFF